jgi:type I restriction enzyme R subunit
LDKKSLNEAEICDRYITPALRQAGWPLTQIRREYAFTAGAVRIRNKVADRGQRRRADYLLHGPAEIPLAIIEAKDNHHGLGAGMEQALRYARALDVPFVFSSNGDAFLLHDLTPGASPVEIEVALDNFPSPETLWNRYRAWKGMPPEQEKIARAPWHEAIDGKQPRYYQRIAVQRTIEAIARGERRRFLLVMATGTGKTYVAFQIIWRLRQAGTIKRVLFLADRDILADQAMNGDFQPFGTQIMTRVQNRQMGSSHEIYVALYQAISGSEAEKNIYRQFPKDFFDLVVVDECHRGSAREDSAWRDILTWFEPAIQLGLTATPKETRDVSNQLWFGEPLYTYSLKQGIKDGFLAPYKVVRIHIDRDLEGWRPEFNQKDDRGQLIEDRIYNQLDMDKRLVLDQRTALVARKVVEYLQAVDPFGKTIVFCEDIEHAQRLCSALRNEVSHHPALGPPDRYVVQITGDLDNKASLYDLAHRKYPVIATTSKLLSTGVDIRPCKLIVLDQRIESMIEFKQIIGRGTRIYEPANKLWFTIMDFKKATELFADPAFDGEPVVIYEPGVDDPPEPPEPPEEDDPEDTLKDPPPDKYRLSNVPVKVAAERVQYLDPSGRLITESITDHTKSRVTAAYPQLTDFLARWSEAERKTAIVDELRDQGVLFEALEEDLTKKVGGALDAFDLICHVVYGRPPLTRHERAARVRKRDVFAKYGPAARKVLEALLDKYADVGLPAVEDLGVLQVPPFSDLGTPGELQKPFGGKAGYKQALRALEAALYESA